MGCTLTTEEVAHIDRTIADLKAECRLWQGRYVDALAGAVSLRDENAKLRELVRDWYALAVGGADSLTDWNHKQADLEQRMRELGVVE